MRDLRMTLLLYVLLCATGFASASVFYSSQQANTVLRIHKRANSLFEELKQGSLERECMEEKCSFEEAREIFKTMDATLNFWTRYYDGDQCDPNPCHNGTCIDQIGSFLCRCDPNFEGRLCGYEKFATNCSNDNGGCDHQCREDAQQKSRQCSCISGYSLDDDNRQCSSKEQFPCGRLQVEKAEDPLLEFKQPREIMPFVVGGAKAKKGHSPWQALILFSGRFHCGGVLIDQNWVLTAAHCIKTATKFRVRLGDYERLRTEHTEVTLLVTEIIVHPNYTEKIEDNDIALLRLEHPVTFTKYIIPICLPPQPLAESVLNNEGTNVEVTGWGKQHENAKNQSSALRYIKIRLASHEECSTLMTSKLTENMLCAGTLGESKDACSGDSGGPMVTKYKNTWFLVGLVSWGEGCGRIDKLGVYTKVSNYLTWIRNIIEEHQSV
ncbi:vitamin K-dependent protein C [Erpetoichthys calabaricus]|uniref:Vitamin K-dependent protein C n=1 Tax=Erpetoichthys calabaricus TaxID=27687 RepID=A0A8C4S611_ERPCA|nr:vitamin K-dependent protein C [Erpetoichthys calabaricus]